MKDIVTIIPSHANNQAKRQLLKNCLASVKTPKIVSTNIPLDEETHKLCDYVIYDSNNPLLFEKDYSKFGLGFWIQYEKKDQYGNITETITKQCEFDHGFAAYTLIANGIKWAKASGFKNCNVVEYDFEWNDEVINIHSNELKENAAVFYRYSPSEWDGFAYNSSFFSGRVDALLHFFGKYNDIDSYYSPRLPTLGVHLLERVLYYGMQDSGYKIKEFSTDYIKQKLKYDLSKKAV